MIGARAVFLFFILSYVHAEYKLSDSKLLLPFYSISLVNYTLEGSDGACYKWSSSAPEVATITPIMPSDKTGCSSKANVSAVWKTAIRATTTIFSECGGHVIKCDIIVDKFHHLEIETTTHELYLHDAPESLTVRGYDEFNNTFSTLDGIPFEWRISSDLRGAAVGPITLSSSSPIEGPHNILRFVTWSESEYASPAEMATLETQGLQGHAQLVSGMKTGSGRVSAIIKDPFYKGLATPDVKLLVMANSVLSPPLVYLIKGTEVKFWVFVVQQGSMLEVVLPSTQYYMNINNETVASLNTQTSIATGLELGHTEIVLHDNNIEEDFRKPSSLLHVVEPGYLSFSVHPGKKWVLEVHREYAVTITVYDHNAHRIYPSDNIRLQVNFPTNHFQIINSTLNGTIHHIKILSKGITNIEATLSHIINTSTRKIIPFTIPIKASQQVELYDPIQVIPPILIIAASNIRYHSKFTTSPPKLFYRQLHAIGGSGDYLWSVLGLDTPGLVQVSVSGELSVVAQQLEHHKLEGSCQVVASDVRNVDIKGWSEVHVLPVRRLAFLPSRVEVEINSATEEWLYLPLAAYDELGRVMLDCQHLKFELSVKERGIVEFDDKEPQITNRDASIAACMMIKVRGVKVGFTDVVVTFHANYYTFHDSNDFNKDNISSHASSKDILTAHITVGAYRALSFAHISNSNTANSLLLVTLGAQSNLRLTHGPQPWVLDPSGYDTSLMVLDLYDNEQQDLPRADIVHIERLSSTLGGVGVELGYAAGRMGFLIKCLGLGKVVLRGTVGNARTMKNQFPVNSSADIVYQCASPVGLQLFPHLQFPHDVTQQQEMGQVPACPYANDTSRELAVHSERSLYVDVHVLDAEGRRFDQCDTLQFTITSSDENIAVIRDIKIVGQATRKIQFERLQQQPTHSSSNTRAFFVIDPQAATLGSFSVTVKIVDYVAEVKVSFDITSSDLLLMFNPEAHLFLRTVQQVSVQPDRLRLFDHADSVGRVGIFGGSGYFVLKVNGVIVTQKEDVGQGQIGVSDEDAIMGSDAFPVRIEHKGLEVTFIPLGGETSGVVQVHDLCYLSDVGAAPSKIHVQVVNVHSIVLSVIDKLQIGHETLAQVQILDGSDIPLPAGYFSKMQLQAISMPISLISVTQEVTDALQSTSTIMFWRIKGLELGTTKLSIKIRRRDGQLVSSNTVDIQIFPPLRLSPSNVTLIKGAQLQLSCTGGPDPAIIEYYLVQSPTVFGFNSSIINLDTNGLVTGMLTGMVQVAVRAVGMTTVTGLSGSQQLQQQTRHVYSMDSGYVMVRVFSGVRVQTPLGVLVVGARMPVYVMGLGGEDETPFAMAGLSGVHEYEWSVSSEQVGRLEHLLSPAGIQISKGSAFSGMRFLALSSGETLIRLRVLVKGKKDVILASNQLLIRVVNSLNLLQPAGRVSQHILMSPRSRLDLKTNKGLLRDSVTFNLLNNSAGLPEGLGLSSDGQLTSGIGLGQAVLLIMANENALAGVNYSYGLPIFVKRVSYVMLNLKVVPGLGTSKGLKHLAIGGPYTFFVSCHDNLGQQFDVSSVETRFRLNRGQFVQLEWANAYGGGLGLTQNWSSIALSSQEFAYLTLRASETGESVVQVGIVDNTGSVTGDEWLGGLGSMDFSSIVTGHAIWPHDLNVVVGDWVCFSTFYERGTWTTDNPDLVSLHRSTGFALAKRPGSVLIRFLISASLNVQSSSTNKISGLDSDNKDQQEILARLIIKPVEMLQLRMFFTPLQDGKSISNALVGESTLLQIGTKVDWSMLNAHFCDESAGTSSVSTSISKLDLSSVSRQNLNDVGSYDENNEQLFACQLRFGSATNANILLDISLYFEVSTLWHKLSKSYICNIKVLNQTNDLLLHLNLYPDLHVAIQATLLSQSRAASSSNALSSDWLQLPLIPAFVVINTDLSLQLSIDQQSNTIKVVANENVERHLLVTSSRKDYVEVLPAQSSFEHQQRVISYPIRLLQLPAVSSQIAVVIKVRHAVTGQTVELKVNILRVPGDEESLLSMSRVGSVFYPFSVYLSQPLKLFGTQIMVSHFVINVMLTIVAFLVFIVVTRIVFTGIRSGFSNIVSQDTSGNTDSAAASNLDASMMMSNSPMSSPTMLSPGRHHSGSPKLWSRGYQFGDSKSDFCPVSPYRRSPAAYNTNTGLM